eukprot:g26485.t1
MGKQSHNDPLIGPLPGPINGQHGQAQEQTQEEIHRPACSPPHWVPKDQERGAEIPEAKRKDSRVEDPPWGIPAAWRQMGMPRCVRAVDEGEEVDGVQQQS